MRIVRILVTLRLSRVLNHLVLREGIGLVQPGTGKAPSANQNFYAAVLAKKSLFGNNKNETFYFYFPGADHDSDNA